MQTSTAQNIHDLLSRIVDQSKRNAQQILPAPNTVQFTTLPFIYGTFITSQFPSDVYNPFQMEPPFEPVTPPRPASEISEQCPSPTRNTLHDERYKLSERTDKRDKKYRDETNERGVERRDELERSNEIEVGRRERNVIIQRQEKRESTTRGPNGQVVKCVCREKDAIRIRCKRCKTPRFIFGKKHCMAHHSKSAYCRLFPNQFVPRILKEGVLYDREEDFNDYQWNVSLYYLQHKLYHHRSN